MANVIEIVLKALGGAQVNATLREVKGSVADIAKELLPFAVGGGVVATIAGMARAAGALADRFDDLSQRVGTTSEAIQVLDYLGRRFGQNAEVFVTSLDHLRVNLQNIKSGAVDGYAPIKRLGLTLAELQGATPERQLEMLARSMGIATDKGQAFNDVAELLGVKAAPELRAALEQLGRDGFDKISDGARNAGQILDQETTQRLADAKKALEDFQRSATIFAGETLVKFSDRFGFSGPEATLRASIAQSEEFRRTLERQRIDGASTGIRAAADRDLKNLDEVIAREKENLATIIRERTEKEAAAKAEADRESAAAAADPFGIKAEAAAIAAAEKARQQAQEQAHAWLAKNRDEYEKAIKAAELLNGTDKERLANLQAEQFRLVAKYSGEEFAAKTAEEHERVRLEARRALLPIEKAIADLTKKIADDSERDAMAAQRRAAELAKTRLETQLSALADKSAALSSDFLRTDAAKWEERKRILEQTVAAQAEYLRQQEKIRDNAQSEDARAQADANVANARRGLAGAQGQLAGIGPNPNSVRDQLGVGFKDMLEEWGTGAQRVAGLIVGPIRAGLQGVQQVMHGLLGDTAYWTQQLGTIGGSVMGAITQAISQLFVQWIAGRVAAFAASLGLIGSETAASTAAAAASTATWTVPATLATIASFGAAAVQAPGAIGISLASSRAITALASAVPGFSEGGFTGAGGIVHANEYVFSAPAVRNLGVSALDSMHDAAKGGSSLASAPTMSANGGQPVNIAIVQSAEAGMRWLDGQRGRKRLIRQLNLSRAELGIVA